MCGNLSFSHKKSTYLNIKIIFCITHYLEMTCQEDASHGPRVPSAALHSKGMNMEFNSLVLKNQSKEQSGKKLRGRVKCMVTTRSDQAAYFKKDSANVCALCPSYVGNTAIISQKGTLVTEH
jgi:hypothetical protein